ncbi:MAG TPA: hypothetical protein VFV26_05500 [Geothrix sp.]|nr:hypothetical protein [Geothrix sp.]
MSFDAATRAAFLRRHAEGPALLGGAWAELRPHADHPEVHAAQIRRNLAAWRPAHVR